MVDIIIGYETIGYEALLPACKIQDFRALESYVAFLFGMAGHFAAVPFWIGIHLQSVLKATTYISP